MGTVIAKTNEEAVSHISTVELVGVIDQTIVILFRKMKG